MPSINKVLILGNLTRNPEIKYTPAGKAVATLGMAMNETWKTDSGEKRESAVFVDVELWGRTAEVAGEYLKKGSQCYIEGSLKLDQWEDKTTQQKRSKLTIRGDKLTMFGGNKGERPAHVESEKPADPLTPDDGDDIPF
jgi:single-strand DNA-binding protein